MSKKLVRKLRRTARKRGYSAPRSDAYTYHAMREMGCGAARRPPRREASRG